MLSKAYGAAAQGEALGCPYKTLSPGDLAEALRGMRLPPRTVDEAVTKAKGHHYQLACTAVFQGQHSCICESGISHPNQVRCVPCPDVARKACGAVRFKTIRMSSYGPAGQGVYSRKHFDVCTASLE